MKPDKLYARMKLFFQYATLVLLILVDGGMLWFLINNLVVNAGAQIDPAVAAIVGSLVGAITTGIAMAVRDLYQPGDTPFDGQETPPIKPVSSGPPAS